MHVGRPVVDRDLIGKLPRRLEILDRQLELADDPAGVAHAHHRRGGEQLDVLAARHVFAEELGVLDRELAAEHHAVRQRAAVEPVEIEDVAAVELRAARLPILFMPGMKRSAWVKWPSSMACSSCFLETP